MSSIGAILVASAACLAAAVPGAHAAVASRSESYSYDARGRLVAAQYATATQAWQQSFGYDANDNWLSDATGAVTAAGAPGGVARFDFRVEGATPVRDVCRVRYTLPNPGKVEVFLFDALGRTVRRAQLGVMTPGEHAAQLRLGDLPAGVYALRLRTDGDMATRSLVVVH